MELATNKSAGQRLRALWHSIVRLVPVGGGARPTRPRRPIEQPVSGPIPGSGARDRDLPDTSRAELLSQIHAGLEHLERRQELVDAQLAQCRYYRDLLAAHLEDISTDIVTLERRRTQYESVSARLREAERTLAERSEPPLTPHPD